MTGIDAATESGPTRVLDVPRRRGSARRAVAVGVVALAAAGVGGALVFGGQDGAGAARAPGTVEEKIANAMLAGPPSITADATILEYPTTGTDYPVLRRGSNGWSCFPDFPASPTNDPGCYDRNAMVWLTAYYKGEKPNLTSPGISYWYEGTSDASWTEDLAEPPPGQSWVVDGPHITIFPAGPLKAGDYAPHTADHHGAQPAVMWPGSPYEHIHVPIR